MSRRRKMKKMGGPDDWVKVKPVARTHGRSASYPLNYGYRRKMPDGRIIDVPIIDVVKAFQRVKADLDEEDEAKKKLKIAELAMLKVKRFEDGFLWDYSGKPTVWVRPDGFYVQKKEKPEGRIAKSHVWIVADILSRKFGILMRRR